MAPIIPKTVGESLYWSYANLAMAFTGGRHNEPTYQQIDFIVRNKLYCGLVRGSLNVKNFIIDEKEKLDASDACCYCGSRSNLSLDHLIPQLKGGRHSADNLVVACRSCNSSKKALDLMEWMAKKKQFPPLRLLRRYLKLAIQYCVENDLMDILLNPDEPTEPKQLTLFDDVEAGIRLEHADRALTFFPFAIALIPHRFPDPENVVDRVPSADQE